MILSYEQILQYDIDILRSIHHNRLELLDTFLYFISFLTSYVSIGILVTTLIVSFKKKSTELRMIFFGILMVLVVASLTSFTLKKLIARERPFKTHPDIEKLSEAGNSSFPSGHTIEAFSMAFAVSFLFRKMKFVIPVYIWAFLVAYSRMALGVHYPTDVLAGIIIGTSTALGTLLIYNRMPWQRTTT